MENNLNNTKPHHRNRISTNGTWQLVYVAKVPKYMEAGLGIKTTNDPFTSQKEKQTNYTLSEIFK